MSDHHHYTKDYYLPGPSPWPIVASIAMFCIMFGAANWLHEMSYGPYIFGLGFLILFAMMFGWFGVVIKENQTGLYDNKQLDRSFRWGMCWFIFSEVMFFGVFFGALYYARDLSIPWLGGIGHGDMTHLLLWPNFDAHWPVLTNPDPAKYIAPHSVMETWGLPALNTLILLTSGLTITVAHWGILKGRHLQALIGQGITVLLGVCFLITQAHEYSIAYLEKGLTLGSGIYGTTFFMLTGFHALHVTLGTIMLIVMFFRIYKRHFSRHNHFAFEAVSWYWHFVDVVWLLLFVFVYWM
jgi:cytochrome c oxidase subunit 3